jgi:ectoine hydroxylase-related dioxygenase (phytanoyl-CoA dioxygenase family)
MRLTEQQINFFEVFGYLRLPGVFADDIPMINKHFDAVFERNEDDVVSWVHETHENRMRKFVTSATEKDEYLASMLDDSRIQHVANTLLGEGYLFTGSDVSIYDCGTLYHQDGIDCEFPDKLNIKMALYLDEIDERTGAVRVIPGSHHRGDQFSGLLIKNWMGTDKLELATEDMPATVLPNSPGDLMLWDYRIMHATSYGGNQRRMLAFEFSQA